MKFFMPLEKIPTATAQEKQARQINGKIVVYEKDSVKESRAILMSALAQHVPEAPMEGAIDLKVSWLFRPTGKHKSGEPKITKPDTDNLNKLLKDCMTQLRFWNDDAQVASEHIVKAWNEPSGIFVEVNKINVSVH